MSWKVVREESVLSYWECEDCHDKVGIEPHWYEQNGTPVCVECDRDMLYSHTEVDCG